MSVVTIILNWIIFIHLLHVVFINHKVETFCHCVYCMLEKYYVGKATIVMLYMTLVFRPTVLYGRRNWTLCGRRNFITCLVDVCLKPSITHTNILHAVWVVRTYYGVDRFRFSSCAVVLWFSCCSCCGCSSCGAKSWAIIINS